MPRTPREVGKQVQEAVNGQVRDLPIHAARLAMFGVGRTLLLTDRVTKDYRDLKEGDVRLVLGRIKDDAETVAGKITSKLSHTPLGPVIDLVVPKPAPPQAATPVAVPPAEITLGKPKAAPEPEPAPKPVVVPEPEPEPAAVEPVAVEPEPVAVTPEPEPVAVVAEPKPKPKRKPKPVAEAVDAVVEPAPEPLVAPISESIDTVELPVPNYDELTHASLRARLRKLTSSEVIVLRAYEAKNLNREEILKMYDNRIAKLSEQE